jgi:transcriptional regulator with XRE-family HTH domain
MAQRPADLTPHASAQHFFGAELRYWRLRSGLSLAQLGRSVYASADLLGKVEKAQRWPSRTLVDDCETALRTGGILLRLYALATTERRAPRTVADSGARSIAARWAPIILVVPVGKMDGRDRIVKLEAASRMTEDGPDGEGGDVVDLGTARARRASRLPAIGVAPRY